MCLSKSCLTVAVVIVAVLFFALRGPISSVLDITVRCNQTITEEPLNGVFVCNISSWYEYVGNLKNSKRDGCGAIEENSISTFRGCFSNDLFVNGTLHFPQTLFDTPGLIKGNFKNYYIIKTTIDGVKRQERVLANPHISSDPNNEDDDAIEELHEESLKRRLSKQTKFTRSVESSIESDEGYMEIEMADQKGKLIYEGIIRDSLAHGRGVLSLKSTEPPKKQKPTTTTTEEDESNINEEFLSREKLLRNLAKSAKKANAPVEEKREQISITTFFSLRGNFEQGMLSVMTRNSSTTEEEQALLQVWSPALGKDKIFSVKIRSYRDGWMSSSYACDATMTLLASGDSPEVDYKWDGRYLFLKNETAPSSTLLNAQLSNSTAVEYHIVRAFKHLRDYQLYWLAKQLVIKRIDIQFHKMIQLQHDSAAKQKHDNVEHQTKEKQYSQAQKQPSSLPTEDIM